MQEEEQKKQEHEVHHLLQVVGVSPDTGEAIRARVRSLEELKEKTECELRRVLLMAGHLPASLRQEVCVNLHN